MDIAPVRICCRGKMERAWIMYISTFNGAMQADGRGGYAFKTIDPYLQAHTAVMAFCRDMLARISSRLA